MRLAQILGPLAILILYSNAHADLFAIIDRGTVYRSIDDGVTWAAQGVISETEIVGLTPGLTTGALFALGKTGSVYQSTSSGAAWSTVGNVGASDCAAIAVARSGALLALTTSGDVSRSTDAGATWVTISSVGASDCAALAIGGKAGASDTLYVATSSGDITRSPTGATWTSVGTTGYTPVVDLLWISAKLYALTDAGEVLLSSNAGATWSAIGTLSQVGMRDLAYVGGKFKAISQEGEVYESATGSSWSSDWIGTTNQVFTVAFAPGVPEFQTGVGAPPLPVFALQARPNVLHDQVDFVLSGVSSGSPAEIRVFDLAGRSVASLPVAIGGAPTRWDGHLRDGSRAASGVYLAELEMSGMRTTIRLTLLR